MKFLVAALWNGSAWFHTSVILAAVLLGNARAAETVDAPTMLLRSADDALRNGKPADAIALAEKVLAADPRDFRALLLRARAHEQSRAYAKAVADYDAVLKLNTNAAMAWQRRGESHFRLGQFKESIADFDKVIELMPDQAPQHWQRGIALYYAGRFEDGRKQFELHQTVNSRDVENAVWHFLCVARASGAEKARAALIPIEGDARVPMAQVHALFAAKAKPEDVLAAAKAGDPPPDRLDNQQFYAHLYLGLYFEAIGDARLAREHILKAATGFKADHYMGDVARVHAQVLRKLTK
jgi:lipoprotein NlpI